MRTVEDPDDAARRLAWLPARCRDADPRWTGFDASGWAAADALATMTEAYGREAVEIGAGGSIPFIADLVELFPGAQILITGVEDPDSRAHSPNESVHLPTFQRAILSEALLLSRLNARS